MRYFTIFITLLITQIETLNSSEKPNIIVIMADDLGWADIGSQKQSASRDVLTPNIDKLFAEGLRFTNGYVASSTCGPSRASFLTGRTSSRFGMEDNYEIGVPTSEIMIPSIIKKQGYHSGLIGKWHLGHSQSRQPLAKGFDYFYGFLEGNHDYYRGRLQENNKQVKYKGYLTDVLADKATEYIQQNKEDPFFLFIAFNAPHSPMQAPLRLVKRAVQHQPVFSQAFERMKEKTGEDAFPNYDLRPYKGLDVDQEIMRLIYCSMVIGLDDGVGKIIQTLDETGLRKDTLVVFLSDNGAALARPNDLGGVNLPLRSGKGTIFDGGLKVCFGASWPGVIPQGQDYDGIINSVDLFTTTVELSGESIPKDRIIDGVNIIPYLTGKKQGNPHETFFYRRKDRNSYSMRKGDFKWLHDRKSKMSANGVLFNLSENESKDVSALYPEKKAELMKLYKELTKDLPEPGPVDN